ncbi:MAG TPA: hypothetical protein V6D19_10295 [Stenomitos sp.]
MRSRYLGLAKTWLQHVLSGVAINIVRMMGWLLDIPQAQTRKSHFARMAAGSATA